MIKIYRDSNGRFIKGAIFPPELIHKKAETMRASVRVHANLSPSKELSYLIGVMLGDGSIINQPRTGNYGIELNAVDREFLTTFSETVSKLLHHHKKPSVHWKKNKRIESGGMWSCKAYSKDLLAFFKNKANSLNNFVRVIALYPADFLRGFYDSEGTVVNGVRASNTRKDIIRLAKKTLNTIGIRCKKVYREFPRETITKMQYKIRGKKLFYSIQFKSKRSLQIFSQLVGFSIQRKKKKLENLLKSI